MAAMLKKISRGLQWKQRTASATVVLTLAFATPITVQGGATKRNVLVQLDIPIIRPGNVRHPVHVRQKTDWAVVNGGWQHLPKNIAPSVRISTQTHSWPA
jgi:hypothetical protein